MFTRNRGEKTQWKSLQFITFCFCFVKVKKKKDEAYETWIWFDSLDQWFPNGVPQQTGVPGAKSMCAWVVCDNHTLLLRYVCCLDVILQSLEWILDILFCW